MEIKIITKDWGKVNPREIQSYIKHGGYEALNKLIKKNGSEQGFQEIKKSGLTGRGGAGFLTSEKLEIVKNKKGKRFFICNLDESEPGTYKDKAIAKNNPHLLIEGIVCLSIICGAEKAYIYINGNYQNEKELLEASLGQAREKKIIGEKVLGSKFKVDIKIISGAGSYICGEETALLNSIEGKRGEPRKRPPYPTDKGLFGFPTLVNNCETIANVPWILQHGGRAFYEIGSHKSPGTKLFIIGGAINNPGIYEVPTGVSIHDLIYKLGKGLPRGKKFWFAQVGGASGKIVIEDELRNILTFDKKAKIPLGSGAIFVADTTVNIYNLLVSWMGFFRRESCGKCVPCREGTFRLYEIAKRFQDGKISDRDKNAISDILWTLENTTFCPFGKFAATAFRDTMDKLLN
jgi:NADH:ubiquinone oxidoreductase subunit F (NADH-binding)